MATRSSQLTLHCPPSRARPRGKTPVHPATPTPARARAAGGRGGRASGGAPRTRFRLNNMAAGQ